MSEYPFQAGGALLADSPAYVERAADTAALRELRRMAYLLLDEPRQQGKSSLINRLARRLGPTYQLILIDLGAEPQSSEAAWYGWLCFRILEQYPLAGRCNPAENNTTWQDFLSRLAESAQRSQQRIVIALDEIGRSTLPWTENFYSTLRAIFNMRQIQPHFQSLTFILSGAFRRRDLIQNENISPFNVAQEVRLADFTPSQVEQLAGHLGLPPAPQTPELAAAIYDWTGGQPYLTQRLCLDLVQMEGATPCPDAVDRAAALLLQQDQNHLPRILARLRDNPRLAGYIQRIHHGEQLLFTLFDDLHHDLHLLGLVKADAQGHCIIRNKLYRQALETMLPPQEEAGYPDPRDRETPPPLDFQRGISALEAHLQEEIRSGHLSRDFLAQLDTLEWRWREVQQRLVCGPSDNLHHEAATIIRKLNEMAREVTGSSFNDLCR